MTDPNPLPLDMQPGFSAIESAYIADTLRLLPPPRNITSYRYPAELGEAISHLAGLQMIREGIDFVHVSPDSKITTPEQLVTGLVVRATKENGHKLGPMRRRRLRKVVDLEFSND